MTALLAPALCYRDFTNGGEPLAFGLVYTYAAGTTTPQATYVDNTQTTQNPNPVVLNARGEASIWTNPALSYKFVVTDSNGNTIRTVDNVIGFNIAVAAGLTSSAIGQALYPETAVEIAANSTPINYSYPPGDVRRYGALLNGTANDAGAIQLALNVSPTYGTTFPGGISIVGTTLTLISGSRLYLQNTVLTGLSTLTGPLISISNINDVQIVGGQTNGNQAAAGTDCIYIYQSTNVTIRDHCTTFTKNNGVNIVGTSGTPCSNIAIMNVRSTLNGTNGINMVYTNESRIEGGICTLNTYSGIVGGSNSRIVISGVQALSNGVGNGLGIGIGMGDSCSFVTITGCTVAYTGSEGINIDGCNHSTVTGCTSYQNLIGISVWNRSPGNVNAGHNTVTGNTCYENYCGMILADNQENIVISANVIRNNGASFTGTPTGTGNVGIYLSGLNDFNINGNTVASNTGDGIYVSSAVGGKITDNLVQLNGQYGIELAAGSGCARILIDSNYVKQNGNGSTYTAGIYNRGSGQIWITRNTLVEENNPGVQQVPINANVTNCIYDANIAYSLNGYIPTITAGRQVNNTWNFQGAAPSTGTWAVGDIVWSTTPSASNPPGWMCTVAGSPGTFQAMANLA